MAAGASARVAYQENVNYAKDAAAEMLNAVSDAKTLGYASIEDAVTAVKKEDVEFAVVPVESTTHGSYYDTYDLLLKYDLAVVGESKPSDKSARFWLVAKTPMEPSRKTAVCKTSLAFAFASGNAHGQLHRALGLFASRHIDLSKVESRPWSSTHPSAGKAEFIFYVDVDARLSDTKVVEAIASLRTMCSYVRVIGCYSSGSLEATNGVLDASSRELTMAQKYPLSPVFDTTKVAKTLAVFAVTKRMEAEGKPVYSLCVGEPDFQPPKRVLDAGIRAIQEGKTKYCDMRGMANLREIIATYLQRAKGVIYDPMQIQVCGGAQQALYNVILAILRPGDKVLLPSPYWGSYEGILAQVKTQLVQLRNTLEENYLINPVKLEEALTANPEIRILILCNPSNPAGTLHSPEQLEQIAAVLRKPQFRHVIVISDEIYEQIVYQDEGEPKRVCKSFASIPDMYERTVLINGFSKAYAMTGLRIGYLAAPSHFVEPCYLMQGQLTSCANSVGQVMAIEAVKMELETMAKGELRIAENLHGLDLKRQYIAKRLQAMPNVRFAHPTSSFYVFVDLALLFEGKRAYTADKSEEIHNVDDFCDYLIRKTGVAVGPGSDMGEPYGFRISYAGSMDTMIHSMDGLESAINSLTFEEASHRSL
ncbi:Aspartate aminotransferase [Phytophthora megakarya]|uniref:Aspartate aminotransferase n=1 Tax=Phytophthora megakarya TaxID=4795 RepID=A0A225WHN5_9STRA|nr:Aspartate aminotransferase [Phytophthora megakarya]